MEAWPGTVAMGMERVDGCESFWWPVHRTIQGPAGLQKWGTNWTWAWWLRAGRVLEGTFVSLWTWVSEAGQCPRLPALL